MIISCGSWNASNEYSIAPAVLNIPPLPRIDKAGTYVKMPRGPLIIEPNKQLLLALTISDRRNARAYKSCVDAYNRNFLKLKKAYK